MKKKKKINKTIIVNKTIKNKNPLEFSKKLFLMLLIQQIVFLTVAFILMFKTGNTEALTVTTTEVFAQTAIAIGFYYWKAKAENVLKIKRDAKKYDIEIDNTEIEDNSENE